MKLIVIFEVSLFFFINCQILPEKISPEKNETFPAINMTPLALASSKAATITNIRFKGVLLNSTDIAINGECGVGEREAEINFPFFYAPS